MITSYEFIGPEGDSWHFHQTELKQVNLLVGLSGAGKTRLLNTIFNIALFISTGEPFRRGTWKIDFTVNDKDYYWEYIGVRESNKNYVSYELLKLKTEEEEVLIKRKSGSFIYKGGEPLPKLVSCHICIDV